MNAFRKSLVAIGALAVAGSMAVSQAAFAGTVSGDVCMQQTFGGDTVTSSNQLNCTANDIALSAVAVDPVTGKPKLSPDSCDSGTQFDLTATFNVIVNANSRYDAGFYFRTDGGPNARGPDGECSLVTLDPTVPPAKQLDGDFCGDFKTKGIFEVQVLISGLQCIGDGTTNCGGDQCLKLPYCTAWHSNAGTPCTTETEADPDTKSKCNCNDVFTVPVKVRPASATLVKKPTQAVVTYSITVQNTNTAHAANLTALCDDTYGTIFGSCNYGSDTGICPLGAGVPDPGDSNIVGTTCAATQLAKQGDPGDSVTCTFDVLISQPGSTSAVLDTVTGTVADVSNSTVACPAGTASATVSLPQP